MKLLSLLAFIAATSTATVLSSMTPPTLQPLFTATVNLGTPLTSSPIPSLGGLRQRNAPPRPLAPIDKSN